MMITVAEAAARIGCARSTVLAMIHRGELTAALDETGRWLLAEDAVAGAPKRGRGHPRVAPETLRGAEFSPEIASGKSMSEVAAEHGVTRQDVAQAVARYDAARKRANSVPKRAKYAKR